MDCGRRHQDRSPLAQKALGAQIPLLVLSMSSLLSFDEEQKRQLNDRLEELRETADWREVREARANISFERR
eukprot:scaffold387_cov244-Pinguiococcus_pyrenoidosus.AAC.19